MYYHFLCSLSIIIWSIEFHKANLHMGVQRKVLIAAVFYLSCMKFRDVKCIPVYALDQRCAQPLSDSLGSFILINDLAFWKVVSFHPSKTGWCIGNEITSHSFAQWCILNLLSKAWRHIRLYLTYGLHLFPLPRHSLSP